MPNDAPQGHFGAFEAAAWARPSSIFSSRVYWYLKGHRASPRPSFASTSSLSAGVTFMESLESSTLRTSVNVALSLLNPASSLSYATIFSSFLGTFSPSGGHTPVGVLKSSCVGIAFSCACSSLASGAGRGAFSVRDPRMLESARAFSSTWAILRAFLSWRGVALGLGTLPYTSTLPKHMGFCATSALPWNVRRRKRDTKLDPTMGLKLSL